MVGEELPKRSRSGTATRLPTLFTSYLPSFGLHVLLVILMGVIGFAIRPLEERQREQRVRIVIGEPDDKEHIKYRDQHGPIIKPTMAPAPSNAENEDSAPIGVLDREGGGEGNVKISAFGLGALGEGANAGEGPGIHGGLGRGGGASFFGVDATGRDFIYIVDKSGSMKGQPLATAKAHLMASLQALGPGCRFHVYFFSDGFLEAPAGGLVDNSPESLARVETWFKNIVGGGGTHPSDALVDALGHSPDAIFLLSDGQFDSGAPDQIAAENADRRTIVHTIGFLSKKGEAVLQRMSMLNGGTYTFVDQAVAPPPVTPASKK